ncbi:protein DELAY OF GERMINATION 1 [Diospyros lotus]|uniref:protein DELAY OF GERMINATION 1 n=1 Tax=Diospyros lotus TaxID=55363 RepID=UPI0022580021|nr:protein DELAY OF GERMINATION 1 [Diospyros lotus]
MASEEQAHHNCCFREWLILQEQDLLELIRGQTAYTGSPDHRVLLSQLVHKNIQHFQDYVDKRSQLAGRDSWAFFAPSWCTSLENSLLWIGGFRPSMFIRLVYSLCGPSEIESQLDEFLRGVGTTNLGWLSGEQLTLVDRLQRKNIKEENMLSSRMASLQENIADDPLAAVARSLSPIGESDVDTDRALDAHAKAMASMLGEADQLRLRTLKDLMGILTPLQGVEFLAASKKLQLSMHEWGKKIDHSLGRN